VCFAHKREFVAGVLMFCFRTLLYLEPEVEEHLYRVEIDFLSTTRSGGGLLNLLKPELVGLS
jgi:hypothetical protein